LKNKQAVRFDDHRLPPVAQKMTTLPREIRTQAGVAKEAQRPGHPMFHQFLEEMGDLHDKKNYDYAFGGSPVGNFDRVAKILGMYNLQLHDPAVVAVIYMLKQLDAYLWMKARDITSRTGEGADERLRDLGIYSTIIRCIEDDKANGR